MLNHQNICGTRGLPVFGRNIEDVLNQLFASSERTSPDVYSPPVNIAETDNAYELTMELPGVVADGISIEYHENVLKIFGERTAPQADDTCKFHRVEHRFGPFQRSFRLPEIDGDRISAEYVNGVLAVRARKVPAAVARKIPVNAGTRQ